jgi:hypothetical protein
VELVLWTIINMVQKLHTHTNQIKSLSISLFNLIKGWHQSPGGRKYERNSWHGNFKVQSNFLKNP